MHELRLAADSQPDDNSVIDDDASGGSASPRLPSMPPPPLAHICVHERMHDTHVVAIQLQGPDADACDSPPSDPIAGALAAETGSTNCKDAEASTASEASMVSSARAWLLEHGVAGRKAEQFLATSGCRSPSDVALYLHFQLPPLRYSNDDYISSEMRSLLGVKRGAARRVLEDLGVRHSTTIPEATMSGSFHSRHAIPGIHTSTQNEKAFEFPDQDKLKCAAAGGGACVASPYREAAERLRRQLPHRRATVTVRTQWDRILLAAAAYIILAVYASVRLFYLLTGRVRATASVSEAYTWLVLAVEVITALSLFHDCSLFWKQEVLFTEMEEWAMAALTKEAAESGPRQTIHVLVTAYSEPADMVREGVLRLLVAPAPVYTNKIIYLCDDGSSGPEGPRKRAAVDELRELGHSNVVYIGDRVKRPEQVMTGAGHLINGKSSNLNHAVLRKIFPTARSEADVPAGHILLVMDCDHMAKPEFFNMMAPVLLDEAVAVAVAPQHFHNAIAPDAFDSGNKDMMFVKQPYRFGAGMCFITGSNCAVRAKAAFVASRTLSRRHTVSEAAAEEGVDARQLFSEFHVGEDFEMGSRIQAAGYASVFIDQKLATGEVPLRPRDIWRQRLRWIKSGHLFLLDRDSFFWRRQRHISPYQRSIWAIFAVTSIMQLLFAPVMHTLPFLCVVSELCPYGMDRLLFWTHVPFISITFLITVYHGSLERVWACVSVRSTSRILWFSHVKACINTAMVFAGWKPRGRFVVTPKAGRSLVKGSGAAPNVSADHGGSGPGSCSVGKRSASGSMHAVDIAAGHEGAKKAEGTTDTSTPADLDPRGMHEDPVRPKSEHHKEAASGHTPAWLSHRTLSRVTEARRAVMPLDGTLDVWVLAATTAMSVVAIVLGVKQLVDEDAVLRWGPAAVPRRFALQWVTVVYALVEMTPGLLFFGYMATYSRAAWLLKIWVPLVVTLVVAGVLLAEFRVAYGFATGK